MLATRKIVVGISGASGSVYAYSLLKKFKQEFISTEVAVVFTETAKDVWHHELGKNYADEFGFSVFEINDFYAPFASGSSNYDCLILCPCSMGMLGRIANGISDDLLTRCADVILKERRKLILLTRETPLNLIHINNMKTITEAGGIICPASPSFYSCPTTILELVNTVTDRILSLAGFDVKSYSWGSENKI